MNLNKIFSNAYRWLAVTLLLGVFVIAATYGFLVAFFAVSNSWAIPLELSPSQERVLSFQPQVVAIQSSIDKQRIELATASAMTRAIELQAAETRVLISKMDIGIATETKGLQAANSDLSRMLTEKNQDIKASQASVVDAGKLLEQIDGELSAKLITSDQATQRRIWVRTALNSITDARMQALQLQEQSRQLKSGAATLGGGASSLTSLVAVKQLVDLQSTLAQLEIQLATGKSTVEALVRSLAENERVIAVAYESPYYHALRKTMSVGFMPYANLSNVQVGDKVYDCWLKVVLCGEAGVVVKVYDSEEYARHPLFKTDLKGKLVEIKFNDADASQSEVVFVGGKPLFL